LLWSTDRQATPLQLPVHWRTKHTTSIRDKTPNKEKYDQALSSFACSNPPKLEGMVRFFRIDRTKLQLLLSDHWRETHQFANKHQNPTLEKK
jgi:hypothetical protein